MFIILYYVRIFYIVERNIEFVLIFNVAQIVVPQDYESETGSEYVINGNNAVFKCLIPSFVADFVIVESWLEETSGDTFYVHHQGKDFTHFVAVFL